MYKGTDDSSKEFAAYFFIIDLTGREWVCGLVYIHVLNWQFLNIQEQNNLLE